MGPMVGLIFNVKLLCQRTKFCVVSFNDSQDLNTALRNTYNPVLE
jgi:hypothetical protein